MSGLATNFIGDCSDSCISIAKSRAFDGKIESKENESCVRCGGILSVSIGKTFVVRGGV